MRFNPSPSNSMLGYLISKPCHDNSTCDMVILRCNIFFIKIAPHLPWVDVVSYNESISFRKRTSKKISVKSLYIMHSLVSVSIVKFKILFAQVENTTSLNQLMIISSFLLIDTKQWCLKPHHVFAGLYNHPHNLNRCGLFLEWFKCQLHALFTRFILAVGCTDIV